VIDTRRDCNVERGAGGKELQIALSLWGFYNGDACGSLTAAKKARAEGIP